MQQSLWNRKEFLIVDITQLPDTDINLWQKSHLLKLPIDFSGNLSQNCQIQLQEFCYYISVGKITYPTF